MTVVLIGAPFLILPVMALPFGSQRDIECTAHSPCFQCVDIITNTTRITQTNLTTSDPLETCQPFDNQSNGALSNMLPQQNTTVPLPGSQTIPSYLCVNHTTTCGQ
jgi:hypothetical protein